MHHALDIAELKPFVFRSPLTMPVQTSFGLMRDRPMLLVRARDHDGAVGWGEVWCNFPAVGAEHRARLISSLFEPLVTSRRFATPEDAFRTITAETAVLALQCAEPGPFAQVIAGIDTALHDLTARRAGQPLWRHLGGRSGRIGVYASGLNPTSPEILAAEKRDAGHRAFKLKIGFGRERDIANLTALRAQLGSDVRLMVDANQAWSLGDALAMLPALADFGLDWLEEPLRADRPWSEWKRLASATSIPLAAGENVMGEDAFARACASGALGVVQPDLAKWGGLSACLPVARHIKAEGLRFCPHYLGGGIGLLASGHLLAAVGGSGALEIDANPNPLRTGIASACEAVDDGSIDLGDEPGLGIEDPLERVQDFAVPVPP
ncbi:MAG: mandelate racemase/muconate lactonizing enzyme family protein [Hyphomicrobiaceae bacterium]